MKILVTGGAGFIGSQIVDKLISQGYSVFVIDNLSSGKKENINPKARFYQLDISDKKIADILERERPEVIFHLAAQINARFSVKNPLFDAQINILGFLNIIENALKNGLQKFIFSSSGGVLYGDAKIIPTPESAPLAPESPYGVAKLASEKYLEYYFKANKLDFISLRYANVYGPRQNAAGEAGVIAIFSNRLLKEEPLIIFGDGTNTRDYVYVEDVVEANIKALEPETAQWPLQKRFLNVGTGKETSVKEITQLLAQAAGKKPKITYASPQPGDIQRSCLNAEKIKKLLLWEPKYTIEEGIRKTYQWFSNYI